MIKDLFIDIANESYLTSAVSFLALPCQELHVMVPTYLVVSTMSLNKT